MEKSKRLVQKETGKIEERREDERAGKNKETQRMGTKEKEKGWWEERERKKRELKKKKREKKERKKQNLLLR